jgi:ribose/xylose/arabinose/galactoside ABC-type transport system permease subunit
VSIKKNGGTESVKPEPGPAPTNAGWRAALAKAGEFRGLVALAFVFLLGVIFTPRAFDTGMPIFLSWRTQLDILYEYSEYGLLATGMTLVILTAGIDLSVGSTLGFCATFFALLTIGFGWNVWVAAATVVLSGFAAGALNGALITRFRIQPFVATLATMIGMRGMAKLISGGIKVQPAAEPWYKLTQGTPPFFLWMTQSLPGIGLQPATILFLVSLLVMGIIVRRTVFGRNLYAIGGNEEAARLSGIKVNWNIVLAYALCAAFAALAGIVNATRQDLGDPEAGFTFELDAIAAVVIGGTSLMGGRGGMFFTMIGVLIVAYINKILSLNAVAIAPRMIIQGAIIVLAVLIQERKK